MEYWSQQHYVPESEQPRNYVEQTQGIPQESEPVYEEPIVRWSWNAYPRSRVDGARMVVPLACVYAPIGRPCLKLAGEPIRCGCGGIMNRLSHIDFMSRAWNCVLCGTRNIINSNSHSTLEYLSQPLSQPWEVVEYVSVVNRAPPTFVFVVDTCVETEDDLDSLKEFLMIALSQTPGYAKICLITYGTTINIHDISASTEYLRSLCLRGSQEVTDEMLKAAIPDMNRFVLPFSICEAVVTSIIESLQRDLWAVPKFHRPLRCTGAALSAAASLLRLASPNVGSCILAFISGACTIGPGIVVGTSKEQIIRGHTDIRDRTPVAQFWNHSCTFYDNLMRKIVEQGHSLTCFTASLDQTGIAEMKLCIQASGGVAFNAETWKQEPFRLSLQRFFEKFEDGTLTMGLNATLDVLTSPTWKVQGIIGQCVGTGKKSSSVAEYEIGLGGTCQWTTCLLDSTSNFAIYFDAAPGNADYGSSNSRNMRYAQFVTRYEIGNETRIRVATVSHTQVPEFKKEVLISAFDQETAAVILARQAIHKTDSSPLFDILRWLDRTIVRLVSRFGDFVNGQPTSLRLPQEFAFFPAFMYHLRRSGYLHVFNSSPDESAIIRLVLLKSSVSDSIIQIQPILYSYRLDAPVEPVLLDSTAIKSDNILLLDTFFEVLIHYGATVAAWKKAGYAEQEEYAHLKDFLEIPLMDAQVVATGRYPTPRLICTSQDDPDARILYNRINPAKSYNSTQGDTHYGSHEGELVYTDDASLDVFTEQLKRLAVSQ